jgi:hypothetical protein
MMRRRYGRTAPEEPANGPTTEDPEKAELARLRQAEADRTKAEAEERAAELAELREFKAKATKEPAVKAPVKKAEKETPPETKPETPAKPRRRRAWWPDDED